MKLHLVSDIHLEHWKPYHLKVIERVPECDALVLAGDIFQWSTFNANERDDIWKAFQGKAPYVMWIPGNHEYYGAKAGAMFHPTGGVMTLFSDGHLSPADGPRFIGDTLWFPYSAGDEEFYRLLNDFSMIQGPVGSWAAVEYGKTHVNLMENVRKDDIVVTHHLPSPLSTPARFRMEETNRFFVGNCEDIIKHRQPKLWLHGHTHDACDYMIGKTRVLCNPMGYPGQRVPPGKQYNPDLLIDV